MTTTKDRSNLMNGLAYVSLALAISAQAGTAIWWAGIINTRVAMIERQMAEFSVMGPEQSRDMSEALRAIAVIEERMIRLDENIARIGTAVGELSRMGARP